MDTVNEVEQAMGMPIAKALEGKVDVRWTVEHDANGEAEPVLIFETWDDVRKANILCNMVAAANGHEGWPQWEKALGIIAQWEVADGPIDPFAAMNEWRAFYVEEPTGFNMESQLAVLKQARSGNPSTWMFNALSAQIQQYHRCRAAKFRIHVEECMDPWKAKRLATKEAKDLWDQMVAIGMGSKPYAAGPVIRPKGVIMLERLWDLNVYLSDQMDTCGQCNALIDIYEPDYIVQEGVRICSDCANSEEVIQHLIENPFTEEGYPVPLPHWIDEHEFGFREIETEFDLVVSMHENVPTYSPKRAWELLEPMREQIDFLFGVNAEQFETVWWLYARRKDGKPLTKGQQKQIVKALENSKLPRMEWVGVRMANQLRSLSKGE